MASDDIKPLLSDRDIDDIILTGSHRNAAGGIYATSVYAFAKEVAIAAIQADREIRAGHVALLKGSMAQAERENDELRAALAQAQSSGQAAPSDAEIIADMEARGWKHLDDEERADIIQFARALLSRYGQAPAASAEPVAWLDPDTADVIHQQRKYDWERFFGEGGKRKAETYTVPLGRIAAPVAAQAPMSDEAIVAEALLFADSSYYGTDLVKRLHFTREGITAFVRSVGGPRAPAANGDAPFLQETDQHALHRFIETTEDDESYDIGKDTVKRLAQLGVVSNHGFGRYSVTAFGYWAHERFWHQNPPLPLRTNSDRDNDARAAMKRTTGSDHD
ncbi:hypothetical protein [Pigmentiphaga sp.]|uniref:hypothetical protein n=1 Tax=Pigmentiphaga sp. TaxID=1977564 RepID=UPI0025EA2CA1|nr:hypothetical protein [Pigmentiphaga sp.]